MCVGLKVSVKAVNPLAPKKYRVSCGKCEECRAVYKEAWNFRLMAELEALMNNGWQAGFITLTYNNFCLPIISPSRLEDLDSGKRLDKVWRDVKYEDRFKKGVPRIPCFDRSEVSDYFIKLRQWLFREYGLSKEFRLRYIACCEYGSNTKRPHMHCLVIFPKVVNANKFFDYMCDAWNWRGFTIPSKDRFYGWTDAKGREHKGFLIESYAKAARYAAKYTTKDIYYDESINEQLEKYRLRFVDDRKYFHHSLAFHCQSKGLGSSILGRLKTDAEKLDAIKNGVFFVGEDKPRVLPVYLKNKILYDNKYVFEMVAPSFQTSADKYELGCLAFGEDFPARRLVRREASDFFRRNVKEIFDLKVKKYAEFIHQLADEGCMRTRRMMLVGRSGGKFRPEEWLGVPYRDLFIFMRENGLTCSDVASLYLCYYGVPLKYRQYVHPDYYYLLYLNRYTDKPYDLDFCTDSSSDGYNEFLDVLFVLLDNCFSWWCRVPKMRSLEERMADCIADFIKSEV